MKVKITVCMAAPTFVRHVGDILDLPTEEAISLINSRMAEPVKVESEKASLTKREKATKK